MIKMPVQCYTYVLGYTTGFVYPYTLVMYSFNLNPPKWIVDHYTANKIVRFGAN